MKSTSSFTAIAALAFCALNSSSPQETDARPDTETVAEQYLLLETPTRGCGESQVAVSTINPKQIAVAAMCILNTNNGKWEQTEEQFTHATRGTITQFAFTRDRGLT